tara:strand:- start:30 stop:203 length:174 start_codon:yes stop_codon:yes gene_type:complete
MSVFLGLLAASTAILLSFSDKIIEYFAPNSELAKIETEVDYMILHIDDIDDVHDKKY